MNNNTIPNCDRNCGNNNAVVCLFNGCKTNVWQNLLSNIDYDSTALLWTDAPIPTPQERKARKKEISRLCRKEYALKNKVSI